MPQLSAVGHGRLAEPDRGVAPPTNNTAPQERGVVLRKALSRLWPQGSQADVLKRELVLLLLEDPDHRLRIAHCDDLMQSRLPGMYTCNGHSPIKLAVAHDPVSQCIFSIEPATPALPTCMGLSTEWGQAVLRLDTSELARCCTHVQDGQVPCVPLIPPPRTAPSARPSAMEQALLLAVAATWPQHDTDDDEYVATALGYVLTSKQDPQLQLPPCSLHLSDLQAWLRVITCNDARLTRRCASILGESPAGAPHSASHSATSSNMGKEAYKEQVHQQVQVKGDPSKEASGGRKAAGKAAAGRMQELLAQPRFKGLLKMRDATSARRGDKVVVLCVDKLAAPSPGAVLPEHLLHWMRVEAAADSAGLLPRAPTPPALVPHDAPANGHTSPGLPKFLFEYEAPELLLHTAPHFGSPIAQRAGGRHAFSMLDTGAVPRALSEPMGSDSNSNSAPSPYSSGHNAAAVMAASRAAAMRPVEPPSFEGKQAPRRGDIFDGLAGSSPPNRLGSGSPTTPSATGPAAGLASNYPAPGTSPSSQGGGHLFGSSPTVGGLKHVPQAIASCWGGGAAGGMQPQQPPQQQQQQQQQAPGGHAPIGPPSAASSSRKRSEGPGSDAHLRGGGAHGQPLARGVQPSAAGDNMSPPSALDASFALLGGSHGSSGSHVGGANGVDPVYWGSGSPEVTNAYRVSGSGGASSSSIALAAARGNMRAAWSGQACSGAPGPVGGGAAPPGSEALQQCTPSSVSEVSEDCGVHGPPDLETTLEAIMSFGEHINEPHGARAAAAAAAHKSFAAAAASAVAGVPPGGYAGPDAVLGGLHGEPHLQPGTGQKAMAAAGRVMTGWAAVAAKDPGSVGRPVPPPVMGPGADVPTSAAAAAAAWRQAVAAGAGGMPPGLAFPGAVSNGNGNGALAPPLGMRLFPKASPRLREEIIQLVHTVPGLKAEDFDEGVLYQLGQKRSEDEAVAALRTLLGSDVTALQHPAAYLNHVIKNFHLNVGGGAADGPGAGGVPSLPSATVRANSVPMSSKTILQRLPLRVYRRLEEIVHNCPHLEWKHFDAGVIKVLSQLAELSDDDVTEELELLQSTDLSAVEYMPAYLNKRLNNRLWSKRKQQHARHVS